MSTPSTIVSDDVDEAEDQRAPQDGPEVGVLEDGRGSWRDRPTGPACPNTCGSPYSCIDMVTSRTSG